MIQYRERSLKENKNVCVHLEIEEIKIIFL